jgi:hypothetical protein
MSHRGEGGNYLKMDETFKMAAGEALLAANQF